MQCRSPSPAPFVLALLAASMLSGCNALSRASQIGDMPPLSTIEDPHKQPGYKPVSLPMPAPMSAERRPNSLWQAGTRAFFKDQRASQIGDILTVVIDISEQAKLANETLRTRTSSDTAGMPHAMGFETQFQKILPHNADLNTLLSASS